MNSRDLKGNIENHQNQRMMDRMFGISNQYTRPHQMIDQRFTINTRQQKHKPQQMFQNNQTQQQDLINLDRMAFNNTNNHYDNNHNKLQQMRFANYTHQNSNRNREVNHNTQQLRPSMTNYKRVSKKTEQNNNEDITVFNRSVNNNGSKYIERLEYQERDNAQKDIYAKFDPSFNY